MESYCIIPHRDTNSLLSAQPCSVYHTSLSHSFSHFLSLSLLFLFSSEPSFLSPGSSFGFLHISASSVTLTLAFFLAENLFITFLPPSSTTSFFFLTFSFFYFQLYFHLVALASLFPSSCCSLDSPKSSTNIRCVPWIDKRCVEISPGSVVLSRPM